MQKVVQIPSSDVAKRMADGAVADNRVEGRAGPGEKPSSRLSKVVVHELQYCNAGRAARMWKSVFDVCAGTWVEATARCADCATAQILETASTQSE